jgi:transcriptional regulator with XRE-family HTH domain
MSRLRDNIPINGAALRIVRVRTGLGVAKLASEVGVSPSYISNLEAGRREAVSPTVFAALNRALRIDDTRALMIPLPDAA